MKIYRTGIVLGAALLLGLTACGGGDTTAAESATPAATSSAESAAPAATDSEVGTEEGCDAVSRTGSTSNTELQAFADAQFESIDCASSTDLSEQLRALTKSADFKQQVADQGWDISDDTETENVALTIRDLDSLSFCMILVLDEPVRGKSINCGDA